MFNRIFYRSNLVAALMEVVQVPIIFVYILMSLCTSHPFFKVIWTVILCLERAYFGKVDYYSPVNCPITAAELFMRENFMHESLKTLQQNLNFILNSNLDDGVLKIALTNNQRLRIRLLSFVNHMLPSESPNEFLRRVIQAIQGKFVENLHRAIDDSSATFDDFREILDHTLQEVKNILFHQVSKMNSHVNVA